MDAELFSLEEDNKRDRHGWNSLENYKQIFEDRVAAHPFVDHTKPHTVTFDLIEGEGSLFLVIKGELYCRNDIIISVEKYAETRYVGRGRLQVRCFSYCYNAYIRGKHTILRYDNQHYDTGSQSYAFDDYHRHEYNTATGEQIKRDSLTREQFPLFHEVLDELNAMFPA